METNKKIVAVSVALMLTTIFSLVAPVTAAKPFYEPVYYDGETVWMNAIEMPPTSTTPDSAYAIIYVFPSGPPPGPGAPPPTFQDHVLDSVPGNRKYSPLWEVTIVNIVDMTWYLDNDPLTSESDILDAVTDGYLELVETEMVFLCAVVNENANQ